MSTSRQVRRAQERAAAKVAAREARIAPPNNPHWMSRRIGYTQMQAFSAGSIPFPEETITRARNMLEGVESHLDEAIEGGPFFGEDDKEVADA
jgi:glutathione S-transferase